MVVLGPDLFQTFRVLLGECVLLYSALTANSSSPKFLTASLLLVPLLQAETLTLISSTPARQDTIERPRDPLTRLHPQTRSLTRAPAIQVIDRHGKRH
ncbi:hypothetical protein D0T12_07065 [Actinomadura spongiicola]|uniref:Uncharacterized protein n=1 Tax=Actinomadura spongiicola TaxID=2303421 RepID=A0A372GLU5_9ACTN|nr:hypothetical protein D0T12_07065 [Actinomadura spongiicola]